MVCSNFSNGPKAVPIPKISGHKFNDLNGNGSLDGGEPALAGWTMRLHNGGGGVVQTRVTDGDGYYEFALDGLGPDNYTVTEDLQSGWTQSRSPGVISVGFGVGHQNFRNNDFGNYQLGSVSGRKFEDINGNGADDSDPGVVGWPLQLTGPDGTQMTTTGAGGAYSFNNLRPGAYTITEGTQPGWEQSYPQPAPPGNYSFNLVSGENKTGRDFGNYRYATVTGRKYEDMGADGTGAGDPGLPGWVIHLDGVDGLGRPVSRTTTTELSGDYMFTNVSPGVVPPAGYTVTEEPQAGWNAKEGAAGYTIHPLSGDTIPNLVFGNWRYATVVADKYDDLNGNGAREALEPGSAGWEIHLDGTDGMGASVARVLTTDASGHVAFSNVVPGTYTVSETQRIDKDWVRTSPSGAGTYSIQPQSGQAVGPLAFLNLVRAEVHGMKFDDMNENGIKEPGDNGLGGWQITLAGVDGMGNPVSRSTTTAADGTYGFLQIMPGTYSVCEMNADPIRWYHTRPAGGDQCYAYVLQSHDVKSDVDFGNYDRSSIAGIKFFDHNRNGSRDAIDEPLSGWVITLTDCAGNVIPQAPSGQPTQPGQTTDANPQVTNNAGQYSFSGLHNGRYCVNENTQSPTWIQTRPCLWPLAACGYQQTELLSGTHLTSDDFANFMSGNKKVPEGNANSVDLSIPAGNLWLCTTGPCAGPGEGNLIVTEHATNVHTGDQNGDTIEDGLGAYEFAVEYDNFVIQSVNPCDIVFSPGGAGAARGNVQQLTTSTGCAANPPALNGTCSFSLILENIVRFGCTTNGQVPGPTGDFDLARLNLLPNPNLTNDIFPGNSNGVVTVLKDNGCEFADVFGHPAIGSINGGLNLNCGSLAVTARILEGDMNLDCKVDVQDEQLISYRYGSAFGSALYSKWYDLEPALHDLDIDIKDLQKVFGRDGSTCQQPVPAQPPLGPPAPFGG